MASSMSQSQALAIKATDKKRDEYLKDVVLSLKQELGGVPELLLYAPLAITTLGHLRFLAYKPGVLSLKLTLQEQSKIRYPSLVSALEQLAQLSEDAFDLTSDNMKKVELKGQTLFGGNSVMAEILNMLPDPQYAQHALEPAMQDLKDGVQECQGKMQEITSTFRDLLSFTRELELLVADKSATTASQYDLAETSRNEAERQRVRYEKDAAKMEKVVHDATASEKEAESDFKKTLRGNEWKMFSLKLAGDVTDVIFGTINETLKGPRLAAQVVESVARIRKPGADALTQEQTASTSDSQNGLSHTQESSGLDQGLALADAVQDQVKQLQSLVEDDDLNRKLQDDGGDDMIKACVDGLRELSTEVEAAKMTGPVSQARLLLKDAIRTGNDIISKGPNLARQLSEPGPEWNKAIGSWKRVVAQAANRADRLSGLALSQPGQAFGNRSSTIDPFENVKQSTLLLRSRQAKLEVRRQALERAQADTGRNKKIWQEAMDQAAAFADKVAHLDSNKASLAEVRKILKAAVALLWRFHNEMKRVLTYFNTMSTFIQTIAVQHTKIFLRTVQSGIQKRNDRISLDYGPQQAIVIRNTMLQLRCVFTLVIQESRLYQRISADCVQPCLSKLANLPMGEISDAEQKSAMDDLCKTAEDARQRIKVMAIKENDQIFLDLGGRIEQVDAEIAQLKIENRLPALSEETRVAIQEGVEESAKERDERREARVRDFQETFSDM